MTFDLLQLTLSHCALSEFGILSKAGRRSVGYSFESGGERRAGWRVNLERALLLHIVHSKRLNCQWKSNAARQSWRTKCLFAVSPRGWIDIRIGCLRQSTHSKNPLIDCTCSIHLPLLLLSPSFLCCAHVPSRPSTPLSGTLHCFSILSFLILLLLPTQPYSILSGSGTFPKSSAEGEIQPLLSYCHSLSNSK